MLTVELMGPPEANIILGDYVKSRGSIHSMLQRKLAASVLNPTVQKYSLKALMCTAKTGYMRHEFRHTENSAHPTHNWPKNNSKGLPAYED